MIWQEVVQTVPNNVRGNGDVWVPRGCRRCCMGAHAQTCHGLLEFLQLGVQVLLRHFHTHLAQNEACVLCSARTSDCSLLDLGVSNIKKLSPTVEEASIKENLSKDKKARKG